MGKAAPPPPQSYRDVEDADAVSMHTTAEDYEYDDAPDLPSYSDSEAAAATSSAGAPDPLGHVPLVADPYPAMHGRTNAEPQALQMSGNKVLNGLENTIRMDPQLNDPDRLQEYLEGYVSQVPPRPVVRIVGKHRETHYNASNKKNETKDVLDFDIGLSLQHYLDRKDPFREIYITGNSDKTYRGSWLKKRAKGYKQDIEVGAEAAPTLQDWCRNYCASKSWLKVFRISRPVEGLDAGFIQKEVERHVRATHYHGHIHFAIQTEEKNIDIYSPHWINQARTSWVRYIFYFTFLWLITWPILFFMTKWWTVYEVRWLWSVNRDAASSRSGGVAFSGITELDWVKQHANLIKTLVLERHCGDATEFATDIPDQRVEGAMRGRMPSTGNANLDSAVNFVQGGVGLWNAVQGRGGGDRHGWGHDC